MKWLEIIELRAANSSHELLEKQLEQLINEMEKEIKDHAIKGYHRYLINTDFSIHLFHDSKETEISKSGLGLRLASALKELGLVHHSIWVEM